MELQGGAGIQPRLHRPRQSNAPEGSRLLQAAQPAEELRPVGGQTVQGVAG